MKFIPVFLLVCTVAFGGDQGWIVNESNGGFVTFMDQASNRELSTASLNLTGAPTAIQPDTDYLNNKTTSPTKMFVLNPSLKKIHVVKTSDFKIDTDISAGPNGNFDALVNLRQMRLDSNSRLYLVLVSNKNPGTNPGVIYFIDPSTSPPTVEHEMKETIAGTTFVDATYTYSNSTRARLWLSNSAGKVLMVNIGTVNITQLKAGISPGFNMAFGNDLARVLIVTDANNNNVISGTGFCEVHNVPSAGKLLGYNDGTNNRVYVVSGSNIKVLNADYALGAVTSPNTGNAEVANITIGATILDMKIVGTKLYVLRGDSKVSFVDLTNNTYTITTNDVTLTSAAASIAPTTDDRYLYAFGETSSFQIDLSTSPMSIKNTITNSTSLTTIAAGAKPNNSIMIVASGGSTTGTGLTPDPSGGSLCGGYTAIKGNGNWFVPIFVLTLFALIYLIAVLKGQRREEI